MKWTTALCAVLALGACKSKPSKESVPTATPVEAVPAPVAKVDLKAMGPEGEMVQNLASLQFSKLGNPVLRWDHIPPVLAPTNEPHKLLVLLVEYPDQKFDRFQGDADQGKKLAAYYQEQLFDDNYSRVDTLSHYYANQSQGAYHVTGTVLEPITLPRPLRYYGSPHRPDGGSWRNDAEPEGLVADALALAAQTRSDLDWSDFDRWDPQDIDNDGELAEQDGYLDHFVIVFAGKGQSSCEGLHKVGDVLTPNVDLKQGLKKLSSKQRACADRIWPHRSKAKANEGNGPSIAGDRNRDGGIPVTDSVWVRDYNMQSEYTDASTFIHEFGHSIGLPDVYSRTSSNSTGSWEVMSGTTSPSPQSLSSWSRMQLGWLKPRVVLPPRFGGPEREGITLAPLDAPMADNDDRAALVVLPPKKRSLKLTGLSDGGGKRALYSGQGNEMNRTATWKLDKQAVMDAIVNNEASPLALAMDAWWEIEAGWDFSYVETSTDGGQSWQRATPSDKRHMPAKHGHDGKDTLPGFTGLSGDLDGDGKNESNPMCDPTAELPHGEDKKAEDKSPCLIPSWVHVEFALKNRLDEAATKNSELWVRIRYYTDGAAVERGILVDNVSLANANPLVREDFEDDDMPALTLDGFSPSAGEHELLVPHYYLVEYRNPDSTSTGEHRYDAALAESTPSFYAHPESGEMMAVEVKSQPGVLLWYYNGAFAWSENDPSINGPGKGYLLAVDANTTELELPGLESWLVRDGGDNSEHYDVAGEDAQTKLADAYKKTVCFIRSAEYQPKEGAGRCSNFAAVQKIPWNGRPLHYSYEVYNELLPGEAREAVEKTGELLDTRTTKDGLRYRLRDRLLRALHTRDATFRDAPHERATVVYRVENGELKVVSEKHGLPVSSFDDSSPSRYLNEKLPFGGVELPTEGFSFAVQKASDRDAYQVDVTWKR